MSTSFNPDAVPYDSSLSGRRHPSDADQSRSAALGAIERNVGLCAEARAIVYLADVIRESVDAASAFVETTAVIGGREFSTRRVYGGQVDATE